MKGCYDPELICKYIQWNSSNFANEVVELLQTDKIFVLNNLPDELTEAMSSLFIASDDVFDQMHLLDENKYPCTHEIGNATGLFRPGKYVTGCYNGPRFMITTDAQGNPINEELPLYNGLPVMSATSTLFHHYTTEISKRILTSIEDVLHIKSEELTSYLADESYIVMTRFYPITQGRLLQLCKENHAAFDINSNKLVQFAGHYDDSLVTLITYRGGTKGLQVAVEDNLGNLIMKTLKVNDSDKPYLVVFTGNVLNILTNGQIPAIYHRVITTPQAEYLECKNLPNQCRSTLARFTFVKDREIKPAQLKDGSIIKPYNLSKELSYNFQNPRQYLMDSYNKLKDWEQKNFVTHIPPEIIKEYPCNTRCDEFYIAQLGEQYTSH